MIHMTRLSVTEMSPSPSLRPFRTIGIYFPQAANYQWFETSIFPTFWCQGRRAQVFAHIYNLSPCQFSTHSNDQHVEIKLKNNYTVHVVVPLFYTLYKFILRIFLNPFNSLKITVVISKSAISSNSE